MEAFQLSSAILVVMNIFFRYFIGQFSKTLCQSEPIHVLYNIIIFKNRNRLYYFTLNVMKYILFHLHIILTLKVHSHIYSVILVLLYMTFMTFFISIFFLFIFILLVCGIMTLLSCFCLAFTVICFLLFYTDKLPWNNLYYNKYKNAVNLVKLDLEQKSKFWRMQILSIKLHKQWEEYSLWVEI